MSPEKQTISSPKITLGLSVHRPEMIPVIAGWMRQHKAVFLEEPPAENFQRMLDGAFDVDDYLKPLDLEYPAFSRQMCCLLQELKAEGIEIFQVEPYLEVLIGIHEFFADGRPPEELDKNSILYPVYLAERSATGALLSYYQTAMTGTFEKTIAAILQFARRDAARFRLRDSLRAQALAPLVKRYPSNFIEAGVIHYALKRPLQRYMPSKMPIKIIFLADTALESIGEKGHLYGPGDQLTLLYLFHPDAADTGRHQLFAARSIIYSKIIEKEEKSDDLKMFPHLRDELACIRMTRHLTLNDCRRLFPLVRRAPSRDARQIVADYRRKNYGGRGNASWTVTAKER